MLYTSSAAFSLKTSGSMGMPSEVSLHSVHLAHCVRISRKFSSGRRRRNEIIRLNKLITKSKSSNSNEAILAERTVINKAVEYIDQLHEKILDRLLNGEFPIEGPIVEHIVRNHLQSLLLPHEKRLALEKLLHSKS